jgi:hypothetical protein
MLYTTIYFGGIQLQIFLGLWIVVLLAGWMADWLFNSIKKGLD